MLLGFPHSGASPVVVQVLQSNFEESQLTTSILCFVTIMALLICSKETNITMFHDPNLRNEGTNLQNGKSEEWKNEIVCHAMLQFVFGLIPIPRPVLPIPILLTYNVMLFRGEHNHDLWDESSIFNDHCITLLNELTHLSFHHFFFKRRYRVEGSVNTKTLRHFSHCMPEEYFSFYPDLIQWAPNWTWRI